MLKGACKRRVFLNRDDAPATVLFMGKMADHLWSEFIRVLFFVSLSPAQNGTRINSVSHLNEAMF